MTEERSFQPFSGWALILPFILLPFVAVWIVVEGIMLLDDRVFLSGGLTLAGGILTLIVSIFMLCGFFTVAPNESRVMVLFGVYKGTVRRNGFAWANPLMTKIRISLRARNLNGEKLKVNDKVGNPIEIAAVVVWRVENTAQAAFDVDDYETYVETQSEAAVRHLAGTYAYDTYSEEVDENEISLRDGREAVNADLEGQLTERLARAGVEVIEARISHLAYASEIAGAMLQRQQASAVVAARQKIVDGAVGMVQMALDRLAERGIVELDEERKASMVSNLLVVLCSDRATQPVVNTGTLYG
jgi:regulator of protease activity HflC (stomatin/prohibitin superfamily)